MQKLNEAKSFLWVQENIILIMTGDVTVQANLLHSYSLLPRLILFSDAYFKRQMYYYNAFMS